MPILRLNAGPSGLALHRSPAPALPTLRRAAHGEGPVFILIHGFKYDPRSTGHSPHDTIFGSTAQPGHPNRNSWLPHLGFGTGNAQEGLAIAFGWQGRSHFWQAWRTAPKAGASLAVVISEIRRVVPRRPIHVITHSMGSEVIFQALQYLTANDVQRIINLSAASYVSRARAAMKTPAGAAAALFNVTSRENDVFDAVFERLVAPPEHGDRALGLGVHLPNCVNIQLDCTLSLRTLQRFGGHIAPPRRRLCHWSTYTRPGALQFYARILRHSAEVELSALQAALPNRTAPRWSRFFARPQPQFTLPLAHKAAS